MGGLPCLPRPANHPSLAAGGGLMVMVVVVVWVRMVMAVLTSSGPQNPKFASADIAAPAVVSGAS